MCLARSAYLSSPCLPVLTWWPVCARLAPFSCSNLTSLSIAGGGAVTDAGLLAVTGALPQLTEVTLSAPQADSSAGAGGEGEGGLARRDCSALADSLAARGVTLIQVRRLVWLVNCDSLSRRMSERPATQQQAWTHVAWP